MLEKFGQIRQLICSFSDFGANKAKIEIALFGVTTVAMITQNFDTNLIQ